MTVSTHVHDEDPCLVELVNSPLRRNANGADKELRLLFDDNVNELRELALGVIVLQSSSISVHHRTAPGTELTLVLRALPPIWGMRRSTPNGAFLSCRSFLMAWICRLRGEHVHKRTKRVTTDLGPEDLRCIAHSSDDTQTSCIRDRSCEFRASSDVHTWKHEPAQYMYPCAAHDTYPPTGSGA